MEAHAEPYPIFSVIVLGYDCHCCCLEYIFLLRDFVSMRDKLGLELGTDRLLSDTMYGYTEYVDGLLWDRCVDRFCDYAHARSDNLAAENVSQKKNRSDKCVHGWNIVCSPTTHYES